MLVVKPVLFCDQEHSPRTLWTQLWIDLDELRISNNSTRMRFILLQIRRESVIEESYADLAKVREGKAAGIEVEALNLEISLSKCVTHPSRCAKEYKVCSQLEERRHLSSLWCTRKIASDRHVKRLRRAKVLVRGGEGMVTSLNESWRMYDDCQDILCYQYYHTNRMMVSVKPLEVHSSSD